MMRQEKMRTLLQYGLTAAGAAGLFAAIFLLKGLFPFGSGSILMTDLYSQYTPLLYRFFDVATGAKSLLYDLSVSGGANLYVDTVNELFNPFNYTLLLFGRDRLYLAVNVLLILYGTCAAVTACILLQSLWPRSRKWNVILSISYAFCGYMAYNFQIIKWMPLPVLFPLFLLAAYRLIEGGRGVWYAVLLAWQLILSIQPGFMTLLFVLFGGGFYVICCVKKGERNKRLGRLGLYTLAGLLLSSFVTAPNILVLLSSSRAGENLSYTGVMKQHGLDDLFERLFQIFHPVLAALSVRLLAKGRGRGEQLPASGRKERGEAFFLFGMNAFLWLTVLLQPANLLWHLGSYVCFPVRYAYMVLLMEACLVKWLFTRREAAEDSALPARGRVWPLAVSGLLCAAAVLITLLWEERLAQAFSSLAISRICPAETLVSGVVLLLLFLGALSAVSAGTGKRAAVFAVTLLTGVCYFAFIILPDGNEARSLNAAAYERMTVQAQSEGGPYELFTRTPDDEGLPLNAALVNKQSSLSGYFPTGSRMLQEAMEGLGYLTPWVATRSDGGTKASDFALGIVREGGAACSGLLFDLSAEELRLSSGTALERQAALSESISGEPHLRVENLSEAGLSEDGCLEVMVKGRRTLYLDAQRTAELCRYQVNDAQIIPPEASSADSPHRLISLGSFQDETVHVKVTDRSGNPAPPEGMQLGLLDAEGWEASVNAVINPESDGRQRAAALDAQQTAQDAFRTIRVTIPDAKAGQTVFLPLAALSGWSCSRNGENVAITPVLGGFMGIETVQGTNVITLKFIPPGFRTGLLLSAAAALALAASGVYAVMRAPGSAHGIVGVIGKVTGKVTETAGFVYRILFVCGLLAVYVIPAAGLCLWMAYRIFQAF